jgi:hypothetical protein
MFGKSLLAMAEKDNLLALQMATLYKYYFPHNLAFSHA